MTFADLHIHALAGCDDGAKTEDEMFRMVDLAYQSGTRILCLTPHYHPGYFGENRPQTDKAFEQLLAYAQDRYPDLELYLGNELRYDKAASSWLRDGKCRTMNNSRYVLVDFLAGESLAVIEKGLQMLLSGGYIPVLAHVERYRALRWQKNVLHGLKRKGVVFQMDAGALLGEYGFLEKHWSRVLLKNRWIDLISSDAHDTKRYRPELDAAYHFVNKRYGTEYAERLFWITGSELIRTMDREG